MPSLGLGLSLGLQPRRPSFTGPLDGLTVSPVHAISSQSKLTGSASGNAVHIRRVSDSETDDFAWLPSGLLDEASIDTFLSATSGRISTAYTSVGSVNAIQSTASAQPAWAATGLNSKPAFDFDGSNHFFNVASIGGTMGGFFCVFQPDSTVSAGLTGQRLMSRSADNNYTVALGAWTSVLANEIISIGDAFPARNGWCHASDSLAANTPHVLCIIWTGSNYAIRVNGDNKPITTNGTMSKLALDGLYLGVGDLGPTFQYFNGKISDMALFTGDPTVADCQSFEAWAAENRGVTL